MTETLPEAQERNAVSFVDRPKLSKTKSYKPEKKKQKFSLAQKPSNNKPANEQDNDDDDFARAEESDSSDYDNDGVPRTELIPSPHQDRIVREQMEITLERFSNSNDTEILDDMPITQTVDDAQLGIPKRTQNT